MTRYDLRARMSRLEPACDSAANAPSDETYCMRYAPPKGGRGKGGGEAKAMQLLALGIRTHPHELPWRMPLRFGHISLQVPADAFQQQSALSIALQGGLRYVQQIYWYLRGMMWVPPVPTWEETTAVLLLPLLEAPAGADLS